MPLSFLPVSSFGRDGATTEDGICCSEGLLETLGAAAVACVAVDFRASFAFAFRVSTSTPCLSYDQQASRKVLWAHFLAAAFKASAYFASKSCLLRSICSLEPMRGSIWLSVSHRRPREGAALASLRDANLVIMVGGRRVEMRKLHQAIH